MVEVRLAPVALAEKPELRRLLDPYLIAHADIVDPEGRHGDPTDYPHFDAYWTQAERRPFWISVGDDAAGFALVNRYSPSGLGCDAAVAEFCILPTWRRAGIGLAAARAVFATTPGLWELQVYEATAPALAFWPRAIAAAGAHEATEISLADRRVYRFRVG
ncbi:GNAT family N-acetyltransferase [Phenylobacterium sp.]|uniref:GNAT family N-acetyltransferase n=1 Tax=Phenylobacterium sp. TaxID=1871053 RepID=UPI0027321A1E|nr:GNAT family N-acetyltransferase [Phenylobacterium sp.]MDP1617247.1 acetyltransferase [Phenylobacterium sp.]MDP1987776.1 acetyltransferase [Phenylobacterium sp.]